jgi:hypothetical protein
VKRGGTAIRKLHDSDRLLQIGGAAREWEAVRLEGQAMAELMVPPSDVVASHGEAVSRDIRDSSQGKWALINTLENPDQIGLDASEQRMHRAIENDVLELAVDAAESIQAANSIEKMLAHQMAAAHNMAMKLLPKGIEQRDPTHMQKYINSAARLLDVYREGMLALHRMKAGGKQTVRVEHVHVHEGGQAIVGNV